MNKYYVGVDLGGTNIAVGVVNQRYEIIAQHSVKTKGERSFELVVDDIAKCIFETVKRADLTIDDIISVGMGSPSSINHKTGLLVHANNMGWKNVPLYDTLKRKLPCPLYIKNDADCAALGETLVGVAKDFQNSLMVTLGTGVGGGIIINKKIFNGCDHMGAEIGHTKLIFGGVRCTCGQDGCFESYASATALIRQTQQAAKENPQSKLIDLCHGDYDAIDGRTAFDAARQGDEVGKRVVEQYISYVAAGISSLVAIFRPEIIIIGGGISHEGAVLIDPLNQKIKQYTYAAEMIGVPKAVVASLGNNAGIIGAAMLGISE